MSINVANTNSDLSGKTLLTEEGTYTIEGLHTFDRGAAAPFAVGSSSLVVTSLNADKVDGLNASDWTSWTPTWTNGTLGNGTLAASYFRFGSIVFFKLALTWGTTTSSSGGWAFSFPVTALNSSAHVGQGIAIDSSTSQHWGVRLNLSNGTTFQGIVNEGASTAGLNTTVPFTWATGDQLLLSGFYTAASAL